MLLAASSDTQTLHNEHTLSNLWKLHSFFHINESCDASLKYFQRASILRRPKPDTSTSDTTQSTQTIYTTQKFSRTVISLYGANSTWFINHSMLSDPVSHSRTSPLTTWTNLNNNYIQQAHCNIYWLRPMFPQLWPVAIIAKRFGPWLQMLQLWILNFIWLKILRRCGKFWFLLIMARRTDPANISRQIFARLKRRRPYEEGHWVVLVKHLKITTS